MTLPNRSPFYDFLRGGMMNNNRALLSPVVVSESLSERLPTPKFELGQTVAWANVETRGFGKIIGIVFARAASVEAIGFHYAIELDSQSPSCDDCAADWGFEQDLELIEVQPVSSKHS